jgi:hypothetical protein
MRRSIMRLAARMSGEQPRQGMLDTNILIVRRWIDPAELPARAPIRLTARDIPVSGQPRKDADAPGPT